MTTAAELFVLQEIDLAIDGAVARLTEVEAQLGETEELTEARQRVDRCGERLGPLQESQKGLDSEAEGVRAKAAAIENKLYGGAVRNPKELEDYQADLISLRGQLSKREDALLEVMLELEEAEADLREAQATLAEVEESWKAEQASLRQTRAKLREEIETLEAKRGRQADGMDAAALRLYQALRERRQGTAVAVVERGLCQGCRISLPMSVVQKARAGAGLVQCVSCERILLVS
jgi:predicted  nucleic acid-binding Zn-ribbon protein